MSITSKTDNLYTSLMFPYQTLYIYEIQNHFPNQREVFSDNFIGCWYGADYSFPSSLLKRHKKSRKKSFFYPTCDIVLKLSLIIKTGKLPGSFYLLKSSNSFFIPSGMRSRHLKDLIPIKLNPGVVFGSGCHPSTKKCLQSIAMISQAGKPKTVLDLGYGTGILSIAAGKLGAKKVLALDLNNLAVETAREKVLLNHVDATVEVIEGDGFN